MYLKVSSIDDAMNNTLSNYERLTPSFAYVYDIFLATFSQRQYQLQWIDLKFDYFACEKYLELLFFIRINI